MIKHQHPPFFIIFFFEPQTSNILNILHVSFSSGFQTIKGFGNTKNPHHFFFCRGASGPFLFRWRSCSVVRRRRLTECSGNRQGIELGEIFVVEAGPKVAPRKTRAATESGEAVSFWWWFHKYFLFLTSIWGNDPFWLTSFKWVQTTN